MKLSACWIAKNEEKNILRSIDSVKGIVDELVVVDTGSTDSTVEISREAGARVEYFEWIGDFSAARNYALECVSGDIVFFLDADEWFSTELTQDDRVAIERLFTADPGLRAVQLTINNLNDQGAARTCTTGNRILRKAPDVCFKKMIHEQFLLKNGNVPSIYYADQRWTLKHSGYIDETIKIKMSRNIELLEKSATESNDPEERHFQYCYLVREYFQNDDLKESLRCLKLVLAEPEMIRKHCFSYANGFAPLLYYILVAARQMRESVSRRELQRKVVDVFKKNLTTYPGSATIELYFDTFFDCKDDNLLGKISSATAAARKIADSPITYYLETEAAINSQAAQAAFRCGNRAEAMEYAVRSFKQTENQNTQAMHVLINCLRGQSAADIIVFLNSQFDLNSTQKLDFLSDGTRVQDFRDVHAYYLDKRIKSGTATKGDYLYFLILYGKYAEAVEMAKRIHEEATAATVTQIIFMAAVCSGNEQLFIENKDILCGYGDVLDAFFSKKPLDKATNAQLAILDENFPLIALAAGMERADEFAGIYSEHKLFVYRLRTKYCVENGLFELALEKEMPLLSDYTSNCLVIQAMTMVGRLDEAFEKIKLQLDSGQVSETVLKYLFALSERATGKLKAESGMLYKKFMLAYDKMIDLRDALNTGYIIDDSEKKKVKALKSITFAQFKKQIAEAAENPRIDGFADICVRAAKLFEEKKMLAAALECLKLALAENTDEADCYAKMSGLFAAIGNSALAKELIKK